MEKTLRIAGVILLAVGVLALAAGILFRFAFMHTLDGSADFYDSLQHRMMLCYLIAGILLLLGAAGLFFGRRRM